MDEIDELTFTEIQINKNMYFETKCVDVSLFSSLRINMCSTEDVNVYVIWSRQPEKKNIVNCLKLSGTGLFFSDKLDILMKYVKVQIVNGSVGDATFSINVLGSCEKVVQIKEPEPEKKNKSPLRSILKRRSVGVPTKQPGPVQGSTMDFRLPPLILRNNMIIGTGPQRMTTIPGPNDEGDYVLTIRNGYPSWVSFRDLFLHQD